MTKRAYALSAITVSALAIVATAALAADLPSRRAPPVYIPPPLPVFSWTGFYFGANAGVAFNSGHSQSTFFPVGSIPGSTGTSGTLAGTGRDSNKFTGGGQIGYNYELGGAGFGGLGGFGGGGLVVVGVVADAQYLDHRNSTNQFAFRAATPRQRLRARSRPAADRDHRHQHRRQRQFLRYVAWPRRHRLRPRHDLRQPAAWPTTPRPSGYTFGGGVEYSITDNISIGAEYLRVNLNRSFSQTASYAAPAGLGAGTLTVTVERRPRRVQRRPRRPELQVHLSRWHRSSRATDRREHRPKPKGATSVASFFASGGRRRHLRLGCFCRNRARAKARPIISKHGPVGAAAAASDGIVAIVPAMQRSSTCEALSTRTAGRRWLEAVREPASRPAPASCARPCRPRSPHADRQAPAQSMSSGSLPSLACAVMNCSPPRDTALG